MNFMLDPRNGYFDDIKFENIAVRNYPKVAFFCGGSLHQPEGTCDFLSARKYITNALSIKHPDLYFKNAEEVKEWSTYSIYENLIEFEKDIAHICRRVILFVESAGSIAELGAFSVIPEIASKLLVFIQQEYSDSNSFIELGPIKSIKDNYGLPSDRTNTHYLPWKFVSKKFDNGCEYSILVLESISDFTDYICKQITESLEHAPYLNHASEQFTRTIEILFVHDVVRNFTAATAHELSGYFKSIGHTIKSRSIERALFCLEKLDYVQHVTMGGEVYYLPAELSDGTFLTMGGTPKDHVRIAAKLSSYYKEKDVTRHHAIMSVRR